MIEKQVYDKTFLKENFSTKQLARGEYEQCKFIDCNFESANLSSIVFLGCEFRNCNFSGAKLQNSVLQDFIITGCKMIGLFFNDCNQFVFTGKFNKCNLNLSSFYKMNLKGFVFSDCNLSEVDFTETDLKKVVFEDCNLQNAIFERSQLVNTDFRRAYNFSINPAENKLKKTKFTLTGLPGLLENYDILIE